MKWKRGAGSGDVIDARGGGGGRSLGLPAAGGGLGLVGVLVVVLLQVLGGGSSGGFAVDSPLGDAAQSPAAGARGIPASQDPEKDLKDFSAYVFDNVQRTWETTFRRGGRSYEHAKLVLYRGAIGTGCGRGSAQMGPFYCPADQRVYLDLSFYGDMQDRLGASGDFAWAYVIAHEVGHHVQQQLGTSDEVHRLERSHPDDANELSVRLELQADCYAGVWAHAVYRAGDLERGDVEEALGAASAVGDDRLQRAATGRVDPDSFTHGTSEQRQRWFDAGREGGAASNCDTFSGEDV
jgi:predicted metalloprotease